LPKIAEMPATLAAEHPSPASAQCFLHGCRKDTEDAELEGAAPGDAAEAGRELVVVLELCPFGKPA